MIEEKTEEVNGARKTAGEGAGNQKAQRACSRQCFPIFSAFISARSAFPRAAIRRGRY